jgi:hypothetical protein
MPGRRYEVHVRGAIPADVLVEVQGAHQGFEVQTVLSGVVRDQAHLQGLLLRLHSLGLEVLEMRQVSGGPPPPRDIPQAR